MNMNGWMHKTELVILEKQKSKISQDLKLQQDIGWGVLLAKSLQQKCARFEGELVN